jgi:energy-dependent translational throttle protein EttA
VVAVTHDRYFLDNVAGWILELDRGRGIPFEGNYSSWLEQKEKRLEQEEKTRSRPASDHQGRARVGAHQPQGPPGQEQGAPHRFEELQSQEYQAAQRDRRNLHPARRAAGREGHRGESCRKGFGDRLLIDDLSFQIPRGAIVGIIGPTAPARRRSSA